jgi:hypothetical protein
LCDPTISKNAGSEKTNESRLDGGENKNRKEHASLFFLGNLVLRIYFVHNEGAGGVVRKFKKERVFENDTRITSPGDVSEGTRESEFVAPYSQSKLSVMPKYLFASERD